MAFEKRYTARQVAEAVLKTTQDLLAKSELAKAEKMDKCGTFSKVHEKAKREGYSEASADKIAGKAKSMEKYETENSKKLGYKLPEAGRNEHQPEKSDKAFEVKPSPATNACGPESAASGKNDPMPAVQKNEDPRLNSQIPPGNNPKEKAEGNNELAGTTPTQVGQDGKNVPGGDEIKGHLKLAKFIGRMEFKRSQKGVLNG
ncbi:unnamed protein product [Sphagnum balticum]